jgi:integrase
MAKYTKQKSGLYRTTIQIGYDADGKPIKKYLSAPTIKELEQKIFEARNDIAGGLLIGDNTIFSRYASKWLEVYKGAKSVQTVNMYKNALKHFTLLDPVPLKKITRSLVQEQINENNEHPRVCEIMLLTLKQIFKSAQNDGLIGRSPCSGIELPRHVKTEKRALTEEEKQKLRSAVLQPQERLFLLLLYGTGCRPAEAYALNKEDFDFRKGTISISKSVQFDGNSLSSVSAPKTNASIRSVIVSESILRGIKHQLDKIPYDNVLGGNTGEIMNKTKYRTMFNHILAKAGLKDSGITQYTFRHNFVTECYYNGVSLKECQRQMGHKDYKMILEVYSHLDELKENTREKMANMVM